MKPDLLFSVESGREGYCTPATLYTISPALFVISIDSNLPLRARAALPSQKWVNKLLIDARRQLKMRSLVPDDPTGRY